MRRWLILLAAALGSLLYSPAARTAAPTPPVNPIPLPIPPGDPPPGDPGVPPFTDGVMPPPVPPPDAKTLPDEDEPVPGEVLVQLRPRQNLTRFNQDYGTRLLSQMPGTLYLRVGAPAGADANALMKRMSRDVRVASAERNLRLSSPSVRQRWTTAFDGDTGPRAYSGQAGIPQVNFIHASRVASGRGITVAILDTGISRRHAHVAARLLPGWNFIDDTANTDDVPAGLDTDGDGVKDAAVGHGTAIAGLVLRFAPQARLLPVKVMNSDGCVTLWSAALGVRYAVSRGARVLNLSLGARTSSTLMESAMRDAYNAGALVVTTAGNDNWSVAQYPAAFRHTLTVAALNSDNTKASFSNYGSFVDVDAPGVDIVSTFWDGTYVAWSGTSLAAPIVTAEAAVVMSLAPRSRVDQVVRVMLSTSHSVNEWNPAYLDQLGHGGAGLVDFDAAVAAALRGRALGRGGPDDW